MQDISRTKYDGVAMILHWVTALLLIFMIIFGEELIEAGEHEEAAEALMNTAFLPSLHVSFGMAILLLTLLRLIWRALNPPPPYPAAMKSWEVTLSKVTHALFYVLMIGIPFTGWLAFGEFLREEPAMSAVRVFGLFAVPAGPDFGEWAKELHEIGSNAAMALVILHVLAALKHQFVDGDHIFRRMLPH
ncbi:cytochrome b [Aestuariivirga sp.]|uniref:cytochrome b n=1 Tax=Aestuariivirga sp. TaxID=2650926 RepID=UPI00359311A4